MSMTVGPGAVNRITKLGEMTSSGHRLWVGATGLALRPSFDYFNKDVDKETRKYSATKTAVKVAITVFNGVLTRIAAERLGIVLVKKGIIKPLKEGLDPEKFAKGVALAVSFLATVFTTFTLDIPFLNYGLNFALDKLFPGQRHE